MTRLTRDEVRFALVCVLLALAALTAAYGWGG